MPKATTGIAIDRGGALAPMPLAWFRERDYPGVLALCREGCLLPASWEEWRREAGTLEKAARARGSRVNWVEVAPGDLRHWAERRRWRFIDTARLNTYVRQMAGHRTPDSAGLDEIPDAVADDAPQGKRMRSKEKAMSPDVTRMRSGAKSSSSATPARGTAKSPGKTPTKGRRKRDRSPAVRRARS